MPVCEAWNCDNSGDFPGTTFHKFPLDSPMLLKAWVHNVNLPPPWEPTEDSLLCSDHFLERCFERSGSTARLRPDAVPTIFAYPDNRQQDVIEYVSDNCAGPAKNSEGGSESSSLDHSYVRRVRLPEEGESLRKKLKLSRQRVRRLEERVSMLNDMVYSLLNQTIMEM
ncbi:THAP domain-containing protein 1 isoform X2 [Dermacentor silvarum]|uniref:THAP domain-containing protein 1 isoform X2 n=1 Tax=Dermacentor silvarum TaxID=543639 RepID=UPI002100F3D0|nr:THAP domain-containing protein 1 isoform X2 [Dermacentor silvarum]